MAESLKATSGIKKVGKPLTHTQLRVSIDGVGANAGANLQHSLNRYPGFLRNGQGGQINVSWDYLRQVRRDPTISLAREMRAAMILSAEWGVELQDGGDEKQKILIEKTILPLRTHYLRTAIYGEIDYGWRAYEKIFKLADIEDVGKVVTLDELKPLLNDVTFARTDAEGNFIGFLHKDVQTGSDIYIDEAHSLWVNFDDDGLNFYNDPGLLRCIEPYEAWRAADSVARRYDEKIAGAVWHLTYPEGKTRRGGVRTDNYVIAQEIMAMLKASGHLITPSKLLAKATQELEELGQEGWTIQLIEAGSKQADFISRLKYLDTLKARGLYILERAVFEGQFGTKAEAGTHTDAMMMIQDLKHQDLTDLANKEIVNQLTAYNFDAIDEVKLLAKPLTDERTQFFSTMFSQLIANPNLGTEIISNVDIDEVFRILHIPKLSEEEKAKQNTVGGMFEKIGERLAQAGDQQAEDAKQNGKNPDPKEKKEPEKTRKVGSAGASLSRYVQGYDGQSLTLAGDLISQKNRSRNLVVKKVGLQTVSLGGEDILVHLNPTKSRAKLLMQKLKKPRNNNGYVPKDGALAGIVDPVSGDMYFWDGYYATAFNMAAALGLETTQKDYFFADNYDSFETQWNVFKSASLMLGPYEEIEGLAFNPNESDDECGAGSPGGKGFAPGNTCARRGNDRFAKGQKTLVPEEDLIPPDYATMPLREGYEKVAKPKIEALLEKYNGEEAPELMDPDDVTFDMLDEEAQQKAYDNYNEGDMSDFIDEASDQVREEIQSEVQDMWDNDNDGLTNEVVNFMDSNDDSEKNPDGIRLTEDSINDMVDPSDGSINFKYAIWDDDDEFIAMKSREAGLPDDKALSMEEMAPHNEERFREFFGDPEDITSNWNDYKDEQVTEEVERRMEDAMDQISELAWQNYSEDWYNGNMSDSDKMYYVDTDDKDAITGSAQITIPETWQPVTSSRKKGWENANQDDYDDTKGVVRLIQTERAVELLMERDPDLDEAEARAYVSGVNSQVWSAWKSSSVSNYGKALQLACVDELGAKGKKQYEDDRDDIISAIGEKDYEALKAYTRSTWEASQYALEQAGIDETFTTWRAIERPSQEIANTTQWLVGIGTEKKPFLPVGKTANDSVEYVNETKVYTRLPDIRLLRNGAQSASAFPQTPNSWQGVGYNEYFPDGTHAKQRVVLRVNNRREDILSLPVFGQNIHGEQEVITLGTEWPEWEAWLGTAPEETYEEASFH